MLLLWLTIITLWEYAIGYNLLLFLEKLSSSLYSLNGGSLCKKLEVRGRQVEKRKEGNTEIFSCSKKQNTTKRLQRSSFEYFVIWC